MPELGATLTQTIVKFLQGDLRKLDSIYRIYTNQCSILKNEVIQDIFRPKSFNEDTKEITRKLICNRFSINNHLTIMNETDRTIVGLLFHENVIDVLETRAIKKSFVTILGKEYFSEIRSLNDDLTILFIDGITIKINKISKEISATQDENIYFLKCEVEKFKI